MPRSAGHMGGFKGTKGAGVRQQQQAQAQQQAAQQYAQDWEAWQWEDAGGGEEYFDGAGDVGAPTHAYPHYVGGGPEAPPPPPKTMPVHRKGVKGPPGGKGWPGPPPMLMHGKGGGLKGGLKGPKGGPKGFAGAAAGAAAGGPMLPHHARQFEEQGQGPPMAPKGAGKGAWGGKKGAAAARAGGPFAGPPMRPMRGQSAAAGGLQMPPASGMGGAGPVSPPMGKGRKGAGGGGAGQLQGGVRMPPAEHHLGMRRGGAMMQQQSMSVSPKSTGLSFDAPPFQPREEANAADAAAAEAAAAEASLAPVEQDDEMPPPSPPTPPPPPQDEDGNGDGVSPAKGEAAAAAAAAASKKKKSKSKSTRVTTVSSEVCGSILCKVPPKFNKKSLNSCSHKVKDYCKAEHPYVSLLHEQLLLKLKKQSMYYASSLIESMCNNAYAAITPTVMVPCSELMELQHPELVQMVKMSQRDPAWNVCWKDYCASHAPTRRRDPSAHANIFLRSAVTYCMRQTGARRAAMRKGLELLKTVTREKSDAPKVWPGLAMLYQSEATAAEIWYADATKTEISDIRALEAKSVTLPSPSPKPAPEQKEKEPAAAKEEKTTAAAAPAEKASAAAAAATTRGSAGTPPPPPANAAQQPTPQQRNIHHNQQQQQQANAASSRAAQQQQPQLVHHNRGPAAPAPPASQPLAATASSTSLASLPPAGHDLSSGHMPPMGVPPLCPTGSASHSRTTSFDFENLNHSGHNMQPPPPQQQGQLPSHNPYGNAFSHVRTCSIDSMPRLLSGSPLPPGAHGAHSRTTSMDSLSRSYVHGSPKVGPNGVIRTRIQHMHTRTMSTDSITGALIPPGHQRTDSTGPPPLASEPPSPLPFQNDLGQHPMPPYPASPTGTGASRGGYAAALSAPPQCGDPFPATVNGEQGWGATLDTRLAVCNIEQLQEEWHIHERGFDGVQMSVVDSGQTLYFTAPHNAHNSIQDATRFMLGNYLTAQQQTAGGSYPQRGYYANNAPQQQQQQQGGAMPPSMQVSLPPPAGGAGAGDDAASGREPAPQRGVHVRTVADAGQVQQYQDTTAGVGWSEEQAAYCGQTAVIVRYDRDDERSLKCRLRFSNGKEFTWALAACKPLPMYQQPWGGNSGAGGGGSAFRPQHAAAPVFSIPSSAPQASLPTRIRVDTDDEDETGDDLPASPRSDDTASTEMDIPVCVEGAL